MAGDWRAVSEGLSRGFERGYRTGGGRAQQLGKIISTVANRLRSERETGEAMGREKEILGVKGLISGTIEPTQQGGFELPGVGRVRRTVEPIESLTQPIVDKTGKVVGTRPKGAVFQPSGTSTELTLSHALGILSDPMKAVQLKRTYPNLYKKAEEVVRTNLGEGVLKKIAPFELPKKSKKTMFDENIMDTNW